MHIYIYLLKKTTERRQIYFSDSSAQRIEENKWRRSIPIRNLVESKWRHENTIMIGFCLLFHRNILVDYLYDIEDLFVF
jgi:hypothetical protein